jgi:hypothetical protein
MSQRLIELLCGWRGRRFVQSLLEQKGFLLPQKWQRRIIDFCGAEHEEELNHYWDEVAAEVMCSASKCTPNLRKFGALEKAGGRVLYRSSFLDRLANERDFGESPMRNPPLLRGLYEYAKKEIFDNDFAINEFSIMEAAKEDEIKRFNISAGGLNFLKRNLVEFTEWHINALGFTKRDNTFVKQTSAGLVFKLEIDVEDSPRIGGRLPTEFYIYHINDPKFFYVSTSFDLVVPGTGIYAHSRSQNGILLGLLAHIELFDSLLQSTT